MAFRTLKKLGKEEGDVGEEGAKKKKGNVGVGMRNKKRRGRGSFSRTLEHSDLSEGERASILEQFQKYVAEWNASLEDGGVNAEEAQSHLLVVTDACLPSQALAESPLFARLLINYDLPVKKEAYQRRLGACFGHSTAGSPGIVISMLVGGEVALLRNIEEGLGIIIEEMPIQIFELL